MATKITEQMPKNDSLVYGVWLADTSNSDTHVLLERDLMVIGVNPNYSKQGCSNPALLLGKNKCELQYEDSGGVRYKELDPTIVAFAIRKMLDELRDY